VRRGAGGSGRRACAVYPNGITTSYTYDTLNRLTRLKADLGATPVTDFQYVYDNAGNRTRKQQLDYTEDYTYDALYRLIGATRSAGGSGLWQWAYDAVGNRTSAQLDNSVSTSVYNEKNRLTSSTGGGPLRWRGTLNEPGNVTFTSALVNGKPAKMLQGNVFEANLDMTPGNNTVTVQATDVSGNVTTKNYQVNVSGSGATYTYDANGNLSQKVEGADTWGYEWNPENQLTRVTKNSVEQARFKYDPLGRRGEKVAAGVTTTWTYDGEGIHRQVAGSSTLRYVQGFGIDEPLATDDGTNLWYFHADDLGSVVKTTSSSGSVTLTRQYDPYGTLQAGQATPGFAFTGRDWDSESNLHYYRARYYDSKAGRFVSADPIGFFGGINFYAYVENDPVNHGDPTGLLKGPDPFTGIGVCVATGAGAGTTVATMTMGFALFATTANQGSDFSPGERRPPTCDKTNSCDRTKKKKCWNVGSGGCTNNFGKPGAPAGLSKRCNYVCDDGTTPILYQPCKWKGDDPPCPAL